MRGCLILLAFLAAGCGTLPAERSLRIDLPAPAATRPLADAGLTLRLLRFTASGLLQERNLVYVEADAPTDPRQAATIVWEAPPESAASAYLGAALTNAGASVIANGIPGMPNYVLSGVVNRFELAGGATGTAIVSLDVAVSDAKTGAAWLTTSYCAQSAAPDRSLPAVQRAFQTALAQIAAHLVADMAARHGGAVLAPPVPRGSRLTSC
jgi:uncharacterized lipoprotein YmbA